MDGPTDGRTYGQTENPLIEMQGRIYDLRKKCTFTCHITFEHFPMTKSKKSKKF